MPAKHSKSKPRRDDVHDPAIIQVRLSRIEVSDDRREHDDDAINDMTVCIRDVGLINPIALVSTGKNEEGKNSYKLVAGLLRLKAAQRLGWKKINAVVVEGGKDQIRLCEIAENLFREELTVLERSELIAEWVAIVRRQGAHRDHPGGEQPNDKGISKAARKLKLSRAMIGRSEAIAGLSKEAKAAAKEAELADSTRNLMEIAAEKSAAKQLGKVEQIRSRKIVNKAKKGKKEKKKTSEQQDDESPSIAPEDDWDEEQSSTVEDFDVDFDSLIRAWENSPALVDAWDAACLRARERFINEVLRNSTKPVTSQDEAA